MLVQGWVLFMDSECDGWKNWLWRLLTHKDFRHCIIIQKIEYVGTSYYTVVDPSMGWMSVRPLLEFKDENITEFGKLYHYNVKHIVPFAVFPERELTIRGLYSCVGVIKQILGITNYRVWTPRGLYNLLNKINKELTCHSVDQTQVR